MEERVLFITTIKQIEEAVVQARENKDYALLIRYESELQSLRFKYHVFTVATQSHTEEGV